MISVVHNTKVGPQIGDINVNVKVCFYIAQYPVCWTAQSALHLIPGRLVHFGTNSTSQGRIQSCCHCSVKTIFARGVLSMSYRAPHIAIIHCIPGKAHLCGQ